MEMGTPDICDKYRDLLQVAQPVFKSFGGLSRMSADVETLKIKHDNALFWEILKQPGHGRILVVDAEGDYCAVMGDRMADLAVKNGWKGLLIHGYIRDSALLKTMPLGIWALGTWPDERAFDPAGSFVGAIALRRVGHRFVEYLVYRRGWCTGLDGCLRGVCRVLSLRRGSHAGFR